MGTKNTTQKPISKEPVVCQLGWLGVFGGIERYALALSQELTARGIENFFAGGLGTNVKEYFDAANVEYYPLRRKASLMSPALYHSLHRLIKQKQVDVIHVHSFKHALIAAITCALYKLNVKIVITRHTVKRGKGGRLYNWLYRRLHRLIFVSDAAKKEFLTGNLTIDPDKIITIINSIDNRKLGSVTPLDQLPTQATIGFAGRISKEKGVDKLIEALAILKDQNSDFTCKIAGTGDETYVEFIKNLIRKYNLQNHVEMMGFINRMNTFISAINIAVLPSTCVDACSLMAIEYMAAGRPIVASNRGGHTEIIDNEHNGILIEARDSQELAKGLKTLIDNPQLRNNIGNAAMKKYNEQLNFNLFISSIIKQYDI